MRILLIAPLLWDTTQDVEMLDMRGYDVITYAHLTSQDYPHNAKCKPTFRAVRMHIAQECMEGRIPVLHPNASMDLARIVAGICVALDTPLIHLEELPACPPVAQEVIHSLNIAAQYAPRPVVRLPCSTTPKSTNPWRERWAVLKERWLRWEQRFNHRYGDLLKNPVSRQMHAEARARQHVQYKAPENPATTTG